MKIIPVVLALALCVSNVVMASRLNNYWVKDQDTIKGSNASDYLVYIETSRNNGQRVSGSGIVFRDNNQYFVMTGSHVIKEKKEDEVGVISISFADNPNNKVSAKLKVWIPSSYWVYTIIFTNGRIVELSDPTKEEIVNVISNEDSLVANVSRETVIGDIAILEIEQLPPK